MSLYDEYPGGVRLSADEIHVYVVGLGGLRLVRARADEDERHRRKTHGRKRGNHCNTFFHTILPVSRVFSEFSADRQPVVYGVPSLPILTGKRTSVIPDPGTAIPADGGFPLFPTIQYTTGWAALSTRNSTTFSQKYTCFMPASDAFAANGGGRSVRPILCADEGGIGPAAVRTADGRTAAAGYRAAADRLSVLSIK